MRITMIMIMRLVKTTAVIALLSVFNAVCSYADVPRLISFQGNLTDNSGNRMTGTYDFTFRLYDAENSGTMEWQETQSGIAVSNGLYLVQLGANNPLNLAFSKDYWLEIYVKASVSVTYEKLSPRQHLTSSPYAYRSEYANSATNIVNNNYWLGLTTGGVTNLHAHAAGAVTNHVNSHLMYGGDPLPGAFVSDYYIANSTITTVKIKDGAITPVKVSTAAYEHIRVGTATVAYGLGSGNYMNDVKVSSAISAAIANGLGMNTYNLTTSTFTFFNITVSSRISPANDLTIGTSGRKVSFPGNVGVDGTLTYVSTLCFSLGGYVDMTTPASGAYDADDKSRSLGFVWVDFGNLNVTQMILEIYYNKTGNAPDYTWQLWDETASSQLGFYTDQANQGIRTVSITVAAGIPNTPRKLRVRFQSTTTSSGPYYYGSCLRIFTR